jgi:hypothetical protein
MTTDAAARLEHIASLVGRWSGTSRLWRPWQFPVESDSGSTADVGLVAGSRFVTIRYTWACDGKDHEGLILLGREPTGNVVNAAWVDSWHMSDKPLICTGTVDDPTGAVAVVGTYAAPPDPDWSWRTEIAPRGEAGFEIVMWNISPKGEETIAYRNVYEKR